MGRETGFFRESFITVGDLGKNPVSEILGEARNRVFSEDIDTPPKNYEKPGFFGLCRSPGCAGWRETWFFRESFITVGDLAKNPVSEILGGARNRVFSEDIDTPPKNCEKPGF